ncbi:MAG: mannose-6-phosphate isomerase, class I [Lentisphaeria bacterium]|jgi:mannose-6-phosphate isomerase
MDATFYPLACAVQPYAWGQRGAPGRPPYIAELLGRPDNGQPQAELWIGGHPSLPARLTVDGRERSLAELAAAEPAAVLGDPEATGFPFLLKILSCDAALSIQAHPDPAVARILHAKDPAHYPDPFPKPELAIAITPFEALCQFRPVAEIRAEAGRLPALGAFLAAAGVRPTLADDPWLRAAYAALFRAPQGQIPPLCRALATAVQAVPVRTAHDDLYLRLLAAYPDDRGAVSAYFLNHLQLQPGECIYLAANEPHAYLRGTILECMANSDNVVRAGLTPKHVDTEVLLAMLTYSQDGVHFLSPAHNGAGVRGYIPPTPEFQVDLLTPAAGGGLALDSGGAVSLLLVLEGAAELRTPRGAVFAAPRGSIWLWPACLERAEIRFTAPDSEVVRARPNMLAFDRL